MTRSTPAPLCLALLAMSLIALACGSDSVAPEPQAVATTLEKVSGDGQQATAGSPLATDLVVRVRDQDGQPLAGVTVSWQVTSGGGSVDNVTTSTDGQGMGRTRWTLGVTAGDNAARATLAGIAPATFSALGVAGAAATVTLSPDSVTLMAAEDTVRLVAAVHDQHGNGIANPAIVWSSNNESVATVDASGLVRALAAGEVTISATSGAAVGNGAVHVLPPSLVCTDVSTFGTGATLSGALPSVLVNGNVTVAGPTTICGNLVIAGSGQLNLSGQTVTVAGSLTTESSGRLLMQAAADRLTVGGNAAFNGTSVDGELSEGVLEVSGNFTMADGSQSRFRANGAHQVALNGATAQSVTLHHIGLFWNRFQNLRIASPGGVTFATDAQVNGTLTVDATSATVSGAGRTVTVGGNMVDAGHAWRVANTSFSGSPALPAAMTTHAIFTGNATLSNDVNLTGNVTVAGSGRLDLGGHTVNMTGNFTTVTSGRLVMQAAAGRLNVGGNAAFNGTSIDGDLSEGVLEVGGNFALADGSQSRFRANGAHQVALNGATAQSVTLHHIGPFWNRFQNLRIASPGGVTFATDAQVNGTLTVDATSATVSGAGRTVTVGGNMVDAGHAWRVANTSFSGSPALPAAMTTHAIFTGNATLTNDVNLTGDVTVAGAGQLDLGGHTVNMTGHFTTVTSGRLVMQAATGRLSVGGNAAFNGISIDGELNHGVLEVGGNFTLADGSQSRFRANGAHQVALNGATAQSVTLHHIGPFWNRFQNVRIASPGGVTFATDAQMNGTLTVDATSATVSGAGRTVTVGGNMVDAGHAWRVANTSFSGSPALPAAMTTHVIFTGNATLTNDVNLTGDITVAGSGRLDLGGHTVNMTGNFTTVTSGRLVMQNAAGRLSVGGNAAFNGTSVDGDLSEGVLGVAGNFSLADGSQSRFRANGAHRVVLNGTAAQSVTFYHIGPFWNRFQNLRADNPAGVTFANSTRMNGEFDLVRQGTVPGGITVTVAGALMLRTTAVLNNAGTMIVGSCTKEAGHTINGADPCT
jgi:fibronectin-binding autotransporter adhesin